MQQYEENEDIYPKCEGRIIIICPICNNRSSDYFIYRNGYMCCSLPCSVKVSEKLERAKKNKRKPSLPPILIPNDEDYFVCKKCKLEFLETPVFYLNSCFCSEYCVAEFKTDNILSI